ncbi:MAG: 50S ribosomal protein L35 [bacterium]|jgi:large subunit ribosomal protein L35
MPKMKTVSGAKKRFKVTGSGKIRMNHAYKRHILTKKAKKQKRNLGYAAFVSDADMSNVKIMLTIGK